MDCDRMLSERGSRIWALRSMATIENWLFVIDALKADLRLCEYAFPKSQLSIFKPALGCVAAYTWSIDACAGLEY